jgi:hypothetical protein
MCTTFALEAQNVENCGNYLFHVDSVDMVSVATGLQKQMAIG